MNILFLDYMSYDGHRNFNKIHIEALLQLGHRLHLVGKKNHFSNVFHEKMSVSVLPDLFYKKYPYSPLSARIVWIICLLWCRMFLKLSKYDCIVIPTYDPLSVFAFRSKHKVVLITHDGLCLDNNIKLRFFCTLPKHYKIVALNLDMFHHLKLLLPDYQLYHVPHGLCPVDTSITKPTFLPSDAKYIVCPINSHYDASFVYNLFTDLALLEYLKATNLLLCVKENLLPGISHSQIVKMSSHLNKQEYDYLLANASAVILPYAKSYQYKCSGILFECVARDVLVLATDIPAMSIFSKHVLMDLFGDVHQLIDCLDHLRKGNYKQSIDKSIFNPLNYWENVLV